MKTREIIAPVIIVFVLSCLGLTWQEYHFKPDETAITKKDVAGPEDKLGDDQMNAAQLYNDKTMSVKGRVLKVKVNANVSSVELGTDTFTGKVICEFPAVHNNAVEKIKPGQAVVVRGICADLLPDMVLINCIFE